MLRKGILVFGLLMIATGMASGQVVETLTGSLRASGGVSVGPDGYIYVADYGDNLSPAQGTNIYRVGFDGEATLFATGLSGASGNTIDAEGNLYQSNIALGVISKITPDGTVSTFSTGHSGPVGVAINSKGEVFVANCGNNTIRRVTPSGGSELFASGGGLNCPNGLTVDENDNLYTCNFSGGTGLVLRITPDGQVSTVTRITGGNNGHLTYANGKLYVVDRSGNRIFEVRLNGGQTLIAGTGVRGKADGPALQASLSLPNGISATVTGDTLVFNDAVPITGSNFDVLNPIVVRMVTGVNGGAPTSHEHTSDRPEGFDLAPNYPNPFNPVTAIRYELDRAQSITLAIYDIQGRLIRTLVDGFRPEGVQDVVWEGVDNEGQAVSSGMYIYRLQGEGHQRTRKMMLVK